MSDIERFMKAANRAARAIRKGGLRHEPIDSWAQVHESAWEPLAQINELGLITFSSQASIDPVTGNVLLRERSYIEGMMLPEAAKEFCEKINIFTDKVAWFKESKLESGIGSPSIVVSRRQRRSDDCWSGSWRLKIDLQEELTNRLKGFSFIPDDVQILVVSVFDPQWGRPARSDDGLFSDVIKVLTPGTCKWNPEAFRQE